MKYVVNWIPLRIRVRSRNTQPHLKALSNPLHRYEIPTKILLKMKLYVIGSTIN